MSGIRGIAGVISRVVHSSWVRAVKQILCMWNALWNVLFIIYWMVQCDSAPAWYIRVYMYFIFLCFVCIRFGVEVLAVELYKYFLIAFGPRVCRPLLAGAVRLRAE